MTKPCTPTSLVLLTLLMSAAGCGTSSDAPPDAGEAPREPTADAPERPTAPDAPFDSASGPAPSESPHAWLHAGFVSPGATVGELTARFGPPDARTATPTPNRHIPDQTDSIVTLEYDRGLTVEFYSVTGGEDLLQSVVVSAPGIVSYDAPVDVGARWEAVTSILGPPSGRRDDVPFYACEGCPAAESPVYFHLADGTVQRIRYSYYVD